MKSSRTGLQHLAVALLTLAPLGTPLFAQTTATTDPVGFITLNVPGAATAGSAQLSFSGLSLSRAVEYQGAAESATATSLTDSEATWTDNQFNPASATADTATYYIEIVRPAGQATAVPGEGTTYDIIGTNAATKTLTLAQPLATGVVGANSISFKIRKYWTIKDVFGLNNEGGLAGGAPGDADEILINNPSTQTFDTYYYKSGGLGGTGWRNASTGAAAADQKIYPEDGLIIRRKQTTPVNIVLMGAVKTGSTSVPVFPGTNVISNVYAANMTLASSNLFTNNPATGVAGGAPGEADEVLIYNPATSQYKTYYYKQGGLGGSGWRDAGDGTDAANTPIPTGSSVVIRRKAATAFNWATPQHPASL